MGHSTGSGRRLPRGVEPNTRFGRAWETAMGGDATVVIREYDAAIRAARDRMTGTSNTFVRQAAQQEIDRLTEERRRIERRFIG